MGSAGKIFHSEGAFLWARTENATVTRPEQQLHLAATTIRLPTHHPVCEKRYDTVLFQSGIVLQKTSIVP